MYKRQVQTNREAQAEKTAEARRAAEKKQSKNVDPNKNVGVAGDDHASRAQSSPARSSSGQSPTGPSGKDEASEARSGGLPRVTGIRHWSTPDYTRVAIDVESDVKFSSQRIDSPARIFFDLPDTKLASTLVGKSFDVEDGFLKKVRVAQFARGNTRVVLEVDNLSDYDAFLLPDPYRLIIDIHGKNGRAKPPKDKDKDKDAGESTAADLADGMSSPKAIGTGFSDKATVSASEPAAATKKLPTAVVKKIVEADDDDTGASSAEVAKRNASEAERGSPPARKAVVAKQRADGDVSGESDASCLLYTSRCV